MGGLRRKMPVTAFTMLVGVLAISGAPLFSGWYSKDMILAAALGFGLDHQQHILLFVLPLVTAGMTAFYMFRLWFLAFTGKPRDQHVYDHAHESPWVMTLPLVVLARVQRRRRVGLAGVGRGGELPRARAARGASRPRSTARFHAERRRRPRVPPRSPAGSALLLAAVGAGFACGSCSAAATRPRAERGRPRWIPLPAPTSGTSTRRTTRRSCGPTVALASRVRRGRQAADEPAAPASRGAGAFDLFTLDGS